MESAVVPTPGEYTHIIIPHGHTRRVPFEPRCRIVEAPASVCCPCCCRLAPSSSESGSEARAPACNSISSPRRVRVTSASDFDSDRLEAMHVCDEKEKVLVDPLFLTSEASREPSELAVPEFRLGAPASAPTHAVAQAEQKCFWLKCWSSACCGGLQEPEPEGSPPPCVRHNEPLPSPGPTEGSNGSWTCGCCGSTVQPALKATRPPVEQQKPPPSPAPTTPPKKEENAVSEVQIQEYCVNETIKDSQHDEVQIVYIDHSPEPFVKYYFGDDGLEEVPDKFLEMRFNSAAEMLLAAGSAFGVLVTGSAVVIGAAALTAGLTVGIAAKEVYMHLTRNYDI